MYKKAGLALMIATLLIAVITITLALLALVSCANRIVYGKLDSNAKSLILELGQTLLKVSKVNGSNLESYLSRLNVSLSTYHNIQIKRYGMEWFNGKEYFYVIFSVNGTRLIYVSEAGDG